MEWAESCVINISMHAANTPGENPQNSRLYSFYASDQRLHCSTILTTTSWPWWREDFSSSSLRIYLHPGDWWYFLIVWHWIVVVVDLEFALWDVALWVLKLDRLFCLSLVNSWSTTDRHCAQVGAKLPVTGTRCQSHCLCLWRAEPCANGHPLRERGKRF